MPTIRPWTPGSDVTAPDNTVPVPGALVVGETLIDIVRPAQGGVTEHVGGSPANVALALGRLGRPVKLLTWLGHDVYGDMARRHLAASGVTVTGESVSAPSTPMAIARLQPDGSADYEFEISFDLPSPETVQENPHVLHFGSIGAVLEPGATKASDLINRLRSTATICYDPNVRPGVMGNRQRMRPVVARALAVADVVKASDEDLAWLEPGQPPETVLRNWARSGPALAVMTRGANGAVAYTERGDRVENPGIPVTVADTVGAGDAFMAGLIDGLWAAGLLGGPNRSALHLIDEAALRPVLEHAGRIAALTVGRSGAEPPTLDELDEETR